MSKYLAEKESDFRRATYENWPRPILHFRLFDRRRAHRRLAITGPARPRQKGVANWRFQFEKAETRVTNLRREM